MASKFINVLKSKNNDNNNSKNPVVYNMGFDGSEVLVWSPEPFEATGKMSFIRSDDLSRKIVSKFAQTFHELKGCNVIMMPANKGRMVMTLEMFFEKNNEPLPDGKIMNLDSLVTNTNVSKNNLYKRMNVLQNRRLGRTFELNNETKLLLSRFMYGGRNANLPNNKKIWNNEMYHKEIHIPVNDPFHKGYNTERILIRVCGFDIHLILQELYGRDIIYKTIVNETCDENFRSEAKYDAKFHKPMADGTFVIAINQFDVKKVQELFIKENPLPQYYLGVQMYTI